MARVSRVSHDASQPIPPLDQTRYQIRPLASVAIVRTLTAVLGDKIRRVWLLVVGLIRRRTAVDVQRTLPRLTEAGSAPGIWGVAATTGVGTGVGLGLGVGFWPTTGGAAAPPTTDQGISAMSTTVLGACWRKLARFKTTIAAAGATLMLMTAGAHAGSTVDRDSAKIEIVVSDDVELRHELTRRGGHTAGTRWLMDRLARSLAST